MRFTIDEMKRYSEEAPLVENGLVFVISGADKKDIRALYQWLDSHYPEDTAIAFLLTLSSHDTQDGRIDRRKVKHGRGRPRTEVIGTEAVPHIHGLIVNQNEDTCIHSVKESITKYFQKRRKRKPTLRQQKIRLAEGLEIVPYMMKQADCSLSSKGFDFSYYMDCRYNDDFSHFQSENKFLKS